MIKAANKEWAQLSVRIPKRLHRKVLLWRVYTGESINKLVERLLTDELDKLDEIIDTHQTKE